MAGDQRKLLILDLDETLVHVREGRPEGAFDFAFAGHTAIRRPHLRVFLEFAFARFDVAVWSSATTEYVELVVGRIFPDRNRLQFVWSRSRCTFRTEAETREPHRLKEPKKVRRERWSLSSVLTVDDKPKSCRRHYGNLVQAGPFEGDPADEELSRLMPVLERLSREPDVRRARR